MNNPLDIRTCVMQVTQALVEAIDLALRYRHVPLATVAELQALPTQTLIDRTLRFVTVENACYRFLLYSKLPRAPHHRWFSRKTGRKTAAGCACRPQSHWGQIGFGRSIRLRWAMLKRCNGSKARMRRRWRRSLRGGLGVKYCDIQGQARIVEQDLVQQVFVAEIPVVVRASVHHADEDLMGLGEVDVQLEMADTHPSGSFDLRHYLQQGYQVLFVVFFVSSQDFGR